ncbi:ATP-binding protein [Catellatospora vulcania]|uniref:ATP-binding protein n=1 Tax=Catellatospora vulcania TaxID=1460450 RepID=UPI0012D3D1B1|nr:ATP-binding protein [Catellatospora vulcania]
MTVTEQRLWTSPDQRVLIEELDRLHACLGGEPAAESVPADGSRLAQLVEVFRLTGFERDVLLWCAGAELDGRFSRPTFGAALAALDAGHWDALAHAAPLRHWCLVDLGPGPGLVDRPLRIDERVLHHLTGVTCLDARLDGIVTAVPAGAGLVTQAQADLAGQLAATVAARPGRMTVRLDGADEQTRERVAGHVAAELGRLLLVVPGGQLPAVGPDAALLARLVEREVALLGALPLITDAPAAFVAQLGCPVLVTGTTAADVERTVPSPTVADQRELWRQLTGPRDDIDETAASFRFEVAAIETIARDLETGSLDTGGLHHACRVRSRSGLAELADRVEPYAAWDDVVLPPPALDALRDIAGQVRHRTRVYEQWGMGSPRGLGVTALFTGESGTGKTLAAEVLAAELDLDLYRIDLAAVVSKYIGETEKNLKRVFDAADASGAILLFDEADAIFGKRGEVRDSHDRYANLEISYLLQRMETHRGLAILTTNLKSALDRAFLRRIRFVVTFPFPDPAARARIWQRMFGPKVPIDGLDWRLLGRLQLSGGNIRTIALGAAFLAAAADEPVGMAHVLAATRREYAKLDKTLTDTEIGGWA